MREESINDLIDEWHDGASTLSLAEFLGMSEEEYTKYAMTGEVPKKEDE